MLHFFTGANVEQFIQTLGRKRKSFILLETRPCGQRVSFASSSQLPPKSPPHLVEQSNHIIIGTSSPSSDCELNSEQKKVLDLVLSGKSVFFTGAAGTGKSFLLHKIRDELRKIGKMVAVTASTGLAATNIGGCTLHRWSGIGISPSVEIQKTKAKRNKKSYTRAEVLIIDEISMVSGQMFDLLEELARDIRRTPQERRAKYEHGPFGGLQLVLCGDFFQLPPVSKAGFDNTFCFEAKSWSKCVQTSIELTQVYRQRDNEFLEMLNEVRFGLCSPKTEAILKKAEQNQNERVDPTTKARILPTMLYARNTQVDVINKKHLDELPGEVRTYAADDSYFTFKDDEDPYDQQRMTSLLESCLSAKEIALKKDAQVMLLRNISTTLVNGSRGVVVGFEKISPVREEQLIGDGIDIDWIERHRELPVVSFFNGQTVTIEPVTYNVDSFGEGRATRVQVPLRLAYAITIHKSQGLTIDHADVSLDGIFEFGQAYVALSRLRGLEGFKLLSWHRDAIKAHPKVVAFYNTLTHLK